MRLVIKALLFTLLVPGTVTVLLPYVILGGPAIQMPPVFSIPGILALLLGICGAAALLHCIWGFAFYGKGTLAPVHPPERLVIQGLYRFSRNPMYLGVLTVLFAEFVFFENSSMLPYLVFIFVCFHLFVVYYEEPHLTRQFGSTYLEYCRAVPRWGLTRHPFAGPEGTTGHAA